MCDGHGTHAADLRHIWYREWVFAGHKSEFTECGDFITLTVSDYLLVIVRGLGGTLHALHNGCRI